MQTLELWTSFCETSSRMIQTSVLFLGLWALARAQYDIQPPDMERLNPEGLRMSIPDEPGISLFAVHYSVNKPLPGVAAGDWNFDINAPTGDAWVHENTLVQVQTGDTVNFWHYVLYAGAGYQLLEQSWVVPDFSNETTTTTTTSTTESTTTADPGPTTTTTTGPTTTTTTGPTTTTETPNTPVPTTPPPTDGSDCEAFPCLIFEDNFDTLNFDNWQHEITAGGGGNWEFQYYTNNRTNSYVRDGALYLKPTLTEDTYGPGFVTSGNLELWGASPANECTGNQWYGCQRGGNPDNLINVAQSARLRSVYSFNTRYGRIEVEARLPRGDWLWPAIWMLPTHNEYGEWPSSGEIDIMESRGNLDLKDANGDFMGHQRSSSTMHWGPFFELNSYPQTDGHQNGDWGEAFHTYSVEWNANSITFEIDGVQTFQVDPGVDGFWGFGDFENRAPGISNPWSTGDKMAPFDRPMYLVMNVAVGGTGGFFQDAWTNAGNPKPWTNESPFAMRDFWNAKDAWYPTWNPTVNNGEDAAMAINSVRVYKMSAEDVGTRKAPAAGTKKTKKPVPNSGINKRRRKH